jgi:hypothetical protein
VLVDRGRPGGIDFPNDKLVEQIDLMGQLTVHILISEPSSASRPNVRPVVEAHRDAQVASALRASSPQTTDTD